MTREARQSRCPETVLGWIPWYGEGSLSETEEGAVEAHASECADCRAELDMIAGALFEIDPDIPDPDIAFAALTARIAERAKEGEALEDAGADASLDMESAPIHEVEYESMDDLAQLAEWALEDQPEGGLSTSVSAGDSNEGGQLLEGPWSRSKIWAAAAACLLVSLGALGGALYSSQSDAVLDDWAYQSAAAGGAVSSSPKGALVDVVFRESTSAGAISTLLGGANAEIVSGPSSLGVYRIRLRTAGNELGAADESAFLASLKGQGRGDGLAIFAEAVP